MIDRSSLTPLILSWQYQLLDALDDYAKLRHALGWTHKSGRKAPPELEKLSLARAQLGAAMGHAIAAIIPPITELSDSAALVFADIEALVLHLGGQVLEREGSRVKLVLGDAQWRCHRPHPGKEAKKYQVEEAREFLQRAGVEP